jgi:hypothetical protein
MVASVMETVHTEVSNCYQARWLGEADEAPIFTLLLLLQPEHWEV